MKKQKTREENPFNLYQQKKKSMSPTQVEQATEFNIDFSHVFVAMNNNDNFVLYFIFL